MAKKSRRLYYYTVEANGIAPINFNLETQIRIKLQEKQTVEDTIDTSTSGICRCIGYRFQPLNQNRLFYVLRLMSYEVGRSEEAFNVTEMRNECVNTTSVPPPDPNSEFVNGRAYLFVKNNSLILSLSQSFKESTLCDYLNKFLFANENPPVYLNLKRGITRNVRDNIRDIKEIMVSSTASFDSDGNRYSPNGLNESIARGITNTDADLSISSLTDNAKISMYVGYKFNRKQVDGQYGFDEFVNKILQNIDENINWSIDTKNGIIKKEQVLLTKLVHVNTDDGGIISDTNMVDLMRDWYNELLSKNEIL